MANTNDLYNAALGQYGSAYLLASSGVYDATPNDCTVYVISITMFEDTTFAALHNLDGNIGSISTVSGELAHDTEFGTAVPANQITPSYVFPKGVTIYGKWDYVRVATGSCICYIAPQGSKLMV